jgi:hypothetical protein
MTAITVSTNYDDILDIIMPRNAPFFTKWIIVTREDDLATHEVIHKYNYPNVEIMYFDFTAGGNKFNKGGAIRYAQQQIPVEYTGLVLILDSDILLPTKFNEILAPVKFKPLALYGVNTRDDFHSMSHLLAGRVDFEFLRHRHFDGFFQLYIHNTCLLYKDSMNCSTCDSNFKKLFGKRKKAIYTLHVKHLGMANTHWNARVNKTDFVMDCTVKSEDIAFI